MLNEYFKKEITSCRLTRLPLNNNKPCHQLVKCTPGAYI